ncbi:MAG TPA: DUF1501 domain-containing protein [Anaerolineae bacterium]|nr:DUF1501 domain-containing protein [Anaerolineae bacterium]
MSGFEVTRRGFLMGCSSAVAAMAGARFNSVVFGNPDGEPNQEILITIFLRGGMDALNFLPPLAGADRGYYETARGGLQVATNSGLQLGASNFYLNPAASALHDLYTNGSLAIVQGTGMFQDTRSHFDAMSYMELGTPGSIATDSGWITRHLRSADNLPAEIVMPSVAMGYYQPQSVAGSLETLSLSSIGDFQLNTGPWSWRNAQRYALRELYGSDTSAMHVSGINALNAVDIVEGNLTGTYTPAAGANYPADSNFADHLKSVAQMIKQQLGLRSATVDLGGWDTHEGQNDGSYFDNLVTELTAGLAAFYADLNTSQRAYTDRITVVVMSEFGRRLTANADNGTDHGHGSIMLVLGGNVNGGLHGTWPTLAPAALFEGIDVDVTTDYRQVLSEILIRRMANPRLGEIFPGYTGYSPLGVIQGIDLDPIYSNIPTAVNVSDLKASTSNMAAKAATAAGIGLAATAGLVALRNRGEM